VNREASCLCVVSVLFYFRDEFIVCCLHRFARGSKEERNSAFFDVNA